MVYSLHIDGASRGNPGRAGAGFVISDDSGAEVARGGRYLGIATNNFAEYSALIDGLGASLSLGAGELVIFSDSQLLVRQIRGEYRVKSPNIKPLYLQAISLLKNFSSVDIIHIKRELNKDADRMANRAIDNARDKD